MLRALPLVGLCLLLAAGVAAHVRAQSDQTDCGGQPYAEVQIDGLPRLSLGPVRDAEGNTRAGVARTPAQHEEGLMDVNDLPPDSGMVFVYTQPAREGYWMRDTLIPLSIAWLDQNGTILDIQDMDALDDQHAHYPGAGSLPLVQAPSVPVLPYYYALETNVGWFLNHGVGAGQQIALCLGS